MSQQLKEFVKQSGVELRPSNSPSSISTTASNNNFARELEADLLKKQEFPPRLERNIMNNSKYGEFARFIDSNNENNNMNMPSLNENAAQALFAPSPPKIDLTFSKLNPGMFNATVNKQFSGDTRINLKKILMKPPVPKAPIGEGLYIDTKEINGIYGRFVTGFTHTREYGKQGDLGKDFFTVQIKVVVSNGLESKGATVNFYKNGKIRFSGGFIGTNIANQPELVRRFIVNTYSEKEGFLYNPFEYNNLSGQFRINGNFKNFTSIASQKQRLYASMGVTKLDFEPELAPFMYVNYKGHKYIFAQSGNVQISGAPSPSDMLVAYNDGIELVKLMDQNGDVEVTGEVPNNLPRVLVFPKGSSRVLRRLRRWLQRKSAMLFSTFKLTVFNVCVSPSPNLWTLRKSWELWVSHKQPRKRISVKRSTPFLTRIVPLSETPTKIKMSNFLVRIKISKLTKPCAPATLRLNF